jgi:hypothetical protein
MNRRFTITYNNQNIMVDAGKTYLLTFADDRWLLLERRAGNPEWRLKDISTMKWITEEKVREIGELIARKENESKKDEGNPALP